MQAARSAPDPVQAAVDAFSNRSIVVVVGDERVVREPARVLDRSTPARPRHQQASLTLRSLPGGIPSVNDPSR
jgi:hypothetical protein